MIHYYAQDGGVLHATAGQPGMAIPPGTLWIDLMDPEPEEAAFIGQALGVEIPGREAIVEIEETSRLYQHTGTLYMNATLVSGLRAKRPVSSDVMFVVAPDHLVTVRYANLSFYEYLQDKFLREPETHASSEQIFLSLCGSVVDHIADLLELMQRELDEMSGEVFSDERGAAPQRNRTDLQQVVKRLGRHNSGLVKLRESLISMARVLDYSMQWASLWLSESGLDRSRSIERDIRSLVDYVAKMFDEIAFLLSATLGLIDIEQNGIIKVFSIAAVLFLPLTLVGTVYGMNFRAMPELDWAFGYPVALGLMVVSAILPFAWFKWKGWL
ncbi:magnesium transporter CorA family protein [Pseudomonas sp. LFM046]|uniref:magnesium transporter CorA family protein n=1 Tax=Pseudomonas sp. LFM046 TaxID=1608357 RepID=UPI0005CFBC39|nr:magnesium transporter CorA family protein [Pseudomonas sp. LFM046]